MVAAVGRITWRGALTRFVQSKAINGNLYPLALGILNGSPSSFLVLMPASLNVSRPAFRAAVNRKGAQFRTPLAAILIAAVVLPAPFVP